MAPFELFFTLLLRAAIMAVPMAVGLLALRRLFMSETVNAWAYALMVGYSAFALAGLAPWALGFTGSSLLFILTALAAAPIWIAILVVCGIGRSNHYDAGHPTAEAPESRQAPLVLKDPVVPALDAEPTPVPVFRHRRTNEAPQRSNTDTGVLSVARAMRGRASSEARRVRKLLPPPAPDASDLPFLR